MAKALAIYFGPTLISIVESKGKKILNHTQISHSAVSPSDDLEEKVPYELKLVALFKDELRRNKIEASEAALSLSGKDLIIRTFEMPMMPAEELKSAINFEANKYIPFKAEELVSDSQVKFDKLSHSNFILFVGIKKEILDKYLSILSQLNIKVNTLEYSAFSVLRFLKLGGLKDKGIVGFISIDPKEDDEANFVVLEDGFPLFSRDITLISGPEERAVTEKIEPGILLEKLKTELRISLEFYYHKFPTKNIEKTFLVSAQDYRSDFEAFIKEIGLSPQFVEISRHIGMPLPFSLSLIKGFSCSLSKIIKINLRINLLAAKEKMRLSKEMAVLTEIASLFKGLTVNFRVVTVALFICIAAYLFGLYRILPLQKELNNIIRMRPKVISVNPQVNYEELNSIDAEYKKKIATMDSLVKKQLYLTEPLDVIPRIIPEGLWLVDFSFKKEQDRTELILGGIAYVGDIQKEWEMVDNFLARLKESSGFNKYFKEINIVSVEQGKSEKMTVTNFIISCRDYKER